MSINPLAKSLIFFIVVLGLIVTSFVFTASQHDDPENRVHFSLVNQYGQVVAQNDLGGKHLMVFFGFTSCQGICPIQMSKMTRVMEELDKSGHGNRITPVFISVDPERDHPQKVREYLEHFDYRFVGLTGSRAALEMTADSFKTLLAKAPVLKTTDYQISHSSIVYVVDPYSRIVDFVAFNDGHEQMSARIRKVLP